MTPAKPGPKPRDPSTLKTVIVRSYFTPDEAARVDAARGTVDRCVWVREAALNAVLGPRNTGTPKAGGWATVNGGG